MDHKYSSPQLAKIASETEAGLVQRAKNGDHVALNTLIENNRDLLNVQLSKYRKAPVPVAAIEGEAMRLCTLAISKYDAQSGATFRTYLEHTLRGLNRYVNTNKNIARIPENKFLRMRQFMSISSLLTARLHREPTLQELSDELGWSQPDTFALQKALKQRDLAAVDFDEQGKGQQVLSRQHETAQLMYGSLSTQEKSVFDYSMGSHGKPQISSIQEIAKKTGLSTDQVYKIRRTLWGRILHG